MSVLALAAWWLLLPSAIPEAILLALRIYLLIAFGLLAVEAVDAVVDSLNALSPKFARGDQLLELYQRMRALVPLLRRCLEYAITRVKPGNRMTAARTLRKIHEAFREHGVEIPYPHQVNIRAEPIPPAATSTAAPTAN